MDNQEDITYSLSLTQEELDFIYARCSRKAARLEEAHLEDVPCYRLSWQVMTKILKAKKPEEN
jgi:hypothetical protein